MAISDDIQARIKVRVNKPMVNPDNRVSLCGEPFLRDEETGQEYAIIPAHCVETHKKLFPTYEFGEEFEVEAKKTRKTKE